MNNTETHVLLRLKEIKAMITELKEIKTTLFGSFIKEMEIEQLKKEEQEILTICN